MTALRLDRYMAIPFVDGGRDFSGADCAGHYALIVAHEAGFKVPVPDCDAGRAPKRAVELVLAEVTAGRWVKLDGEPAKIARKFDAVLMSGLVQIDGVVRRADIHIGCAIGDGKMIHTEQGCGPRVVSLADPDIRRRMGKPVHGVYRPAFLAR